MLCRVLFAPACFHLGLTMNSHNRTQSVEPTRRTERLMRRALLAMGLLMMMTALGQSAQAAGKDETKFKRFWTPQYMDVSRLLWKKKSGVTSC